MTEQDSASALTEEEINPVLNQKSGKCLKAGLTENYRCYVTFQSAVAGICYLSFGWLPRPAPCLVEPSSSGWTSMGSFLPE